MIKIANKQFMNAIHKAWSNPLQIRKMKVKMIYSKFDIRILNQSECQKHAKNKIIIV